jgi:predicted solute-binding protein
MRDYYTRLGYELDDRMMKALLFYYQQAASLSLAPKCEQLQFIE